MNAISRTKLATLVVLLCVGPGALAEYRCDAPRSSFDRRACEAAKEGPEALGQFIRRMRAVESLHFDDDVNEATRIAREQARERARQAAAETKEPVARGATR